MVSSQVVPKIDDDKEDSAVQETMSVHPESEQGDAAGAPNVQVGRPTRPTARESCKSTH